MINYKNLQTKYSKVKSFNSLLASSYDEDFNNLILDTFRDVRKENNKYAKSYTSWIKSPMFDRGRALLLLFRQDPYMQNIPIVHLKALVATMAFESNLDPIRINGFFMDGNSDKKKDTVGQAWGLHQAQATRKFSIVDFILSKYKDEFALGYIIAWVEALSNDIKSNPDLEGYRRSFKLKEDISPKDAIYKCVTLFEGVGAAFSNQWMIQERLDIYNKMFNS